MACLPLSACDDPQPAHTLPDVQPGGMNYAVIIWSSEFRNTSILKLADQFGTKHQSATPETIACHERRQVSGPRKAIGADASAEDCVVCDV
ncbi:hypothetical protein SNOG_08741 [Parastagonospora nodorum SN15]|uniref:Uncharacterized protein n=1 Tax=Phaeosphaeria nodorum (strain SN15 / ATCC MYA-4574 / FGSC 10173) TaxID=321614 RepID=Q0UHM3_PHANO|nr:hypothetical protein SNOG_08741 [Parastagonospora nodorum SN15]EAT83909.1 hypothetical protein SNOG_08741 [Parastagonospora nodorum SN15]